MEEAAHVRESSEVAMKEVADALYGVRVGSRIAMKLTLDS